MKPVKAIMALLAAIIILPACNEEEWENLIYEQKVIKREPNTKDRKSSIIQIDNIDNILELAGFYERTIKKDKTFLFLEKQTQEVYLTLFFISHRLKAIKVML